MNNSKKKKFRQTRQLVGLAINDGWTQAEIANKCRTQQSIVSSWKNGEQKASEKQIQPLLKIYGNILRRQSFKVYYSLNEKNSHQFYKIEGKVIFSFVFTKTGQIASKRTKEIPVIKLVIHDQGKGNFLLVNQIRPSFKEDSKYLECSHNGGIWHSTVLKIMNQTEVISEIDGLAKHHANEFRDESITLPFIVRKAFLENGYSVNEVKDYPASW